MKTTIKIIIIAFSLFVFTNMKSQTSFSCTYREYCRWNEYSKTYDKCEGYEESSLFVMNNSETMFTHTIESIKSTYYVDEREYDSKNDVYTYSVTSDVGNKYYFVFDPKNKEVRALYIRNGETILLRFYVKSIF